MFAGLVKLVRCNARLWSLLVFAKILNNLESFIVLLLFLVENLAIVPVTIFRFRSFKYFIPLFIFAQDSFDILLNCMEFLHMCLKVILI